MTTLCLIALCALAESVLFRVTNDKETKVASQTQTTRGFHAPCPRCGENAMRISLGNLNDLFCSECETDMTLDEIRDLVNGWQKVIAWLDSAPADEAPDPGGN